MARPNIDNLSIDAFWRAMEAEAYILSRQTATTVYLALRLRKPLLITGPPGVGKTEVAKALSRVFQAPLIRLQCYEGLDENKALYEWNYQRQLLKIEASKGGVSGEELETSLFARDYLLERPLLKAITATESVVLLIDEIDKTDEEFEAFLFEVLSDFQVSIPEMGTITASHIPMVVLTSNGERELSDGLKRRCSFLYLDYPSVDKELRIIETRVPEAGPRLARDVAHAVAYLRRNLELKKQPAVAETLDWVRALLLLDQEGLDAGAVEDTLSLVLKDREDQETFHRKLGSRELERQVRLQEVR